MPFVDDIQRHLREMEQLTAVGGEVQTFPWKGKPVPCVPSSLGRRVVLDRQGNPVEIDLEILVRRDQFLTIDSTLVTIDSELYTIDNDTPTPVSGMFLTFRGQEYVIVTALESAPKSHFELTLKDSASGG